MNDMDANVEPLLRDELQHLAGLPQPDSSDMLRRVSRKRQRGSIVAGALAVLAISTGAIVTLSGSPSRPPATAPFTQPADLTLSNSPQIHFADPDHGFALLSSCPATAGTCSTWLAGTADGGHTWQAHQVPDLTHPNGADDLGPQVDLRVLDTSRIALDSYDGDQRWFTADAGLTWEQASRQPDGTVESIPANGLAQLETNAGGPVGIVVLLPDGRSTRLANPPVAQITQARVDVTFGADGSAWVEGSNDDRSWVFVSRDRGQHWQEVPLPAQAAEPGQPQRTTGQLAVYDGRTAYLVDGGGYRLWRTRDDGNRWEQLAVPISKPAEDIGLIAVPEADGELTITDLLNGRVYTLRGDGQRFEPASGAPSPPAIRIGARFLRGSGPAGRQQPYFHSLDGRTWTELRF